MLFPDSPRVVFNQNPLVEVICQLRFPTILEIGSTEPAAFQSIIRKKYPLYQKNEMQPIPEEISGMLQQLKFPGISDSPVFKFLTDDSKSFISLNQNFLAITTKEYRRWEYFLEDIKFAQGALEKVYQPAFYSRIGLRYRDALNREKLGLITEPWKNLINNSLIGLLGLEQITRYLQEILTTTVLTIDEVKEGQLVIRHGLAKNTEGQQIYIIDADSYTTERSNSADVAGKLGLFNGNSGNFFRWAITERLRQALGPNPIR